MSFSLFLDVSINGRPMRAEVWCDDSQRAIAEDTVERYDAGGMPMEDVLTLTGPGEIIMARSQSVDGVSWRWADIKSIRIEDH